MVFYDVDIQVVVGHLHAVLPEGVPQVLPQSQIRAPPVLRRSPAVDGVLDRALLVCGEVDGGSRVLQQVFRLLQSCLLYTSDAADEARV